MSATSRNKPGKYRAKKAVVDGIKFDSQAEGRRYGELKLLERAGRITALELQPVYQLAPSVRIMGRQRAKPALRYKADFRYIEDGKSVVEDVKGVETEAFKIKQHLMKSVHGIDVRVTK